MLWLRIGDRVIPVSYPEQWYWICWLTWMWFRIKDFENPGPDCPCYHQALPAQWPCSGLSRPRFRNFYFHYISMLQIYFGDFFIFWDRAFLLSPWLYWNSLFDQFRALSASASRMLELRCVPPRPSYFCLIFGEKTHFENGKHSFWVWKISLFP